MPPISENTQVIYENNNIRKKCELVPIKLKISAECPRNHSSMTLTLVKN